MKNLKETIAEINDISFGKVCLRQRDLQLMGIGIKGF